MSNAPGWDKTQDIPVGLVKWGLEGMASAIHENLRDLLDGSDPAAAKEEAEALAAVQRVLCDWDIWYPDPNEVMTVGNGAPLPTYPRKGST